MQQNFAFFPAYPMLMRIGGYAVGAFDERASDETRTGRALWAGTLISIGAFAWGVVFLRRLTTEMIGVPEADRGVALVAAYPFAVFFSAPYTESLFLLAAVAAFYRFRRQEWVSAAAWGLLAGLDSPQRMHAQRGPGLHHRRALVAYDGAPQLRRATTCLSP